MTKRELTIKDKQSMMAKVNGFYSFIYDAKNDSFNFENDCGSYQECYEDLVNTLSDDERGVIYSSKEGTFEWVTKPVVEIYEHCLPILVPSDFILYSTNGCGFKILDRNMGETLEAVMKWTVLRNKCKVYFIVVYRDGIWKQYIGKYKSDDE